MSAWWRIRPHSTKIPGCLRGFDLGFAPPTVPQSSRSKLIGGSKLPVGVNVILSVCLFCFYMSAVKYERQLR